MENSKKLQGSCSPGTLRQISDDSEYVKICSQQFMQEVDKDFDEIIFTPVVDMSEAPLELHDDVGANISTGIIWCDAATKLLLSNFKDLSGKVGKSSNLKNKTRLWRIIAENLAKEGYTFSPSQVESKFRGLQKQYKKIKLNNSQGGRNRSNWMYQDELDEILGIRKGINPEYTLNSENQNIPVSHSSAESSQETLDDVSTSAGARETKKLLKKLEEISKRKEERHNKIIDLLEKKEYNRKIKEIERKEREKRRDELATRIITLLEKVAEKFTK